MKTKLSFVLFMFFSCYLFSQVAIGKDTVDGDALLDFASGTTKGIILPNVDNNTAMTNLTPGTLVFDKTSMKVKLYNGIWKELSDDSGANVSTNTNTDIGDGVIIGANTSSAEGALVLESQEKALILPKINDPVSNVVNPYPGMICYDTSTKLLCVYNGTDWFFWQ
ncbi:MAG: hypothetical protein H6604_06660 [Flavobacteriales bacterium]|nr:hypothetical protein [Flavobacteriales bacterium]